MGLLVVICVSFSVLLYFVYHRKCNEGKKTYSILDIMSLWWFVQGALYLNFNSTQLKGVYFQKYTVSINCNMGLKPTLVYLSHYY